MWKNSLFIVHHLKSRFIYFILHVFFLNLFLKLSLISTNHQNIHVLHEDQLLQEEVLLAETSAG